MKGTDHFKRTIYMYLEQRAEEDALFAKKYRNPAKNMDECVTHILNYVQKSGCNGFTDGEIFGQAIHYYEENEIEVGKPMDCQVVVNHVVKLTAEEKAEARQNAVRKYQEEELRKLHHLKRKAMKRDTIIIEDKAVSVTGNDVWMTATEIAGLFQLPYQISCLVLVLFNAFCITMYDDVGN